MGPGSQKPIWRTPRDLLRELWRNRASLAPGIKEVEDFLPISPGLIAERILHLLYQEPPEIPPILEPSGGLNVEIAGYLDRPSKTIAVAQRFKPEWRRFTGAHEIGHWCLHEGINLHRDRPLTGGERANLRRNAQERQADAFGAELLMPRKLLQKMFIERFGGPFDGRQPDDSQASWLSIGTGESIRSTELAANGPLYRGLLIARTNLFEGKSFLPLAQVFGVSPTAMAIQLKELWLVR